MSDQQIAKSRRKSGSNKPRPLTKQEALAGIDPTKIPKRGSEAWERANADSKDVPKDWLKRRFYKKGMNEITGKMINNVGNGLTEEYRQGYDKVFSDKAEPGKEVNIEDFNYDYIGDDTYEIKGTTITFTHAERVSNSPKAVKRLKKAIKALVRHPSTPLSLP